MNLFENWEQGKAVLLEGVDQRKQGMVSAVLENQKRHILGESATDSAIVAADANAFQKIVMPLIRRVIPGSIASEVVGVQPMSGPVGLVYSLRFSFVDPTTGTNGYAVANGDEMFAPNSKMARFYSSSNIDYAPAPWAGNGTYAAGNDAGLEGNNADAGWPVSPSSAGLATTTAHYESHGGRRIALEMLKQTVSAGSRKLQARWSPEAMQDFSYGHGVDLGAEMTGALAAAIVSDIDNEIINDLLQLAGSASTFDFASATGSSVVDKHAAIGSLVMGLSAQIAAKTRKGGATFMIASPAIVGALQSASRSVFAPAVSGSFEGPAGTKLVGVMNNAIKVYSYVYSDTLGTGAYTIPNTAEQWILLGYKGSSEMDAGYFYCPYIPLVSSEVITNADTFMKHVSLMTRYGKASFTNSAESLGNSADYYARLSVTNLAFN